MSGENGPLKSCVALIQLRDRRDDVIDFLTAKRAGFAGVRIQSGDGNPWFL